METMPAHRDSFTGGADVVYLCIMQTPLEQVGQQHDIWAQSVHIATKLALAATLS